MSCVPKVNVFVYILVILFGMGSWIAVNGLWVELPILVEQAPEKWNLPSYITIIIQIANIGPLLYTMANKLAPTKIYEKHGVFFIVVFGAAGSLMLVFLWKKTSFIDGAKHSTGLLISIFLLSLVDCTSSVVFLPYMSTLKPAYMTAYYIGEGFSGLVPSLVAIVQGVSKTVCVHTTVIVNQTDNSTKTMVFPKYLPPLFSVEDFFYFLFSMMIVCGVSFSLLNYLPYCKRQHVNLGTSNIELLSYTKSNEHLPDKTDDLMQTTEVSNIETETYKKQTKGQFVALLFLIWLTNALTNGVLPALSSYATLPYGSQTYHLTATLSPIANPVFAAITVFLPIVSTEAIVGVTLSGVALSVYVIVIAAYSPLPPLYDETDGAVLIIFAFVMVTGLMTFAKVSIATVLRVEGRIALLWCGIMTQVGSACGAIVTFLLVNTAKLFTQADTCS